MENKTDSSKSNIPLWQKILGGMSIIVVLSALAVLLDRYQFKAKSPEKTDIVSENNPQEVQKKTASAATLKIVESIQKEIIPQEGSQSVEEVTFTNEGYEKLLKYEKEISISPLDYEKNLAGLDVFIPCCGFREMQKKYEDNCQCGHHLALYGLAKYMHQKGYGREEIQEEINKWKKYFFPQDYIKQELLARKANSPQIENALKELEASAGNC